MKRKLGIFLTCVLAVMLLGSCTGRYKRVEVDSFSLVSVTPSGLRSVNAVAEVGISNPAGKFKLKDIEAELYRNGSLIATITLPDMEVEGRADQRYTVSAVAELADNVNVLQVLSLLKRFDAKEFTLNVKTRASIRGAIGKTIAYKDIPLETLLDRL